MAEYIEREAVCSDCKNKKVCIDKSVCPVGRAHAVDVVAVVRCEKCEHRLEPTGMCMNPMAVGWDALDPNDDDFCSRGERRDSDG